MRKNNGGPAFPTDSEMQISNSGYHFQGMTLRDYFAGQALAGWMSDPDVANVTAVHLSETCYDIADEMINARDNSITN